jgi:hypothetical protein
MLLGAPYGKLQAEPPLPRRAGGQAWMSGAQSVCRGRRDTTYHAYVELENERYYG